MSQTLANNKHSYSPRQAQYSKWVSMEIDDPLLRIRSMTANIWLYSLVSLVFAFGQSRCWKSEVRKMGKVWSVVSFHPHWNLHQAISLITQFQTEQRNYSLKSLCVVFAWNDKLQTLVLHIADLFWHHFGSVTMCFYLHQHLAVAPLSTLTVSISSTVQKATMQDKLI